MIQEQSKLKQDGEIDKKPLKSKNQAQLIQAKITSLENEVELLRTRILALENLISNAPLNASSSTQISKSSGTDLTGTIKSLPPNVRQENTASDNKSERQLNEIKSSVMKAVHGDLLNKKHRQRNFVIYFFILLFHQHQLSRYIRIQRFKLGNNVDRNRQDKRA